MKVTQEKLPNSQVGLEIEIPAEKSKQVYEKVVQNLSRTANIPGFRKGKVPRQILLQQLGSQRVKAAALEDLVQDGLKAAVEQEDIKAIGNFQLVTSFEDLIGQFKPGEPLTFSASVDVPPEVKFQDYKGLSVKAEETEYDPADVEKFLEERRNEQATLIPVEGRPARVGDIAVVDYVGRFVPEEGKEPEEISGAKATDSQIELGGGRFIEDLVNGIVGMEVGETREVSVKFPEDYPREDLAGILATFTVTLKEIKEKELPELDDDLAQEVSEFETLAELRDSLETQFKEKAQKATQASKEQAIIAELVTRVEVEFPETMIEQEVENVVRQTVMQLSQMGMDVKNMLTADLVKNMRDRSRPEAIDRLTQSIALEEIAKRESLQVEDAEVEAKVKELMEQLSGQTVDPEQVQEIVKSDLLKEKAVQWLEEQGTVELVPKGTLNPPEDEETEEVLDPSEALIEAEVVPVEVEEKS